MCTRYMRGPRLPWLKRPSACQPAHSHLLLPPTRLGPSRRPSLQKELAFRIGASTHTPYGWRNLVFACFLQRLALKGRLSPLPVRSSLQSSSTTLLQSHVVANSSVVLMGHAVRKNVELNEKEHELFEIFKATLEHHKLKTVLRVAGGWVRDKLLGRASGDIDIALDDMMGSQFAQHVNEYLVARGKETRSIGIIRSNPDQSKHLETATVRVHGQSIDFVNLRSEKYAEDSRIPTVEFGTAEEDAYRRDLTINSLFYNINTGEVEDLTGKGLQDLKEGIIRTPLPPMSTFLDDPLRVLRAIRFGARFGFELEQELVAAAQSAEVRGALGGKISRERIGVEVDLMLSGPAPLVAMRQLFTLNLFATVFALPAQTELAVPLNYGRSCIASLEASSAVLSARSELASASGGVVLVDRRLFFLAALLLPLRQVSYTDTKGKPQPATAALIKEALKLKSKDADQVAALHVGAEEFIQVTKLLNEDTSVPEDGTGDINSLQARQRIAAGGLVRQLKELWIPALALSTVLDADIEGRGVTSDEVKVKAAQWEACEKRIVDLGLAHVWELKPLMDGKGVMSALGLSNPGPILGHLMGRMSDWQLAFPEGSVEDCKAWLRTVQLPTQPQAGPVRKRKK